MDQDKKVNSITGYCHGKIEKSNIYYEGDYGRDIHVGIVGSTRACETTLSQAIVELLKQNIKVGHEHTFIDAKDGTDDKVCSICGVRAKQARMYLK